MKNRLLSILNLSLEEFDEDKSLLEQIDSLQIVHLVTKIEREFNIKFSNEDLRTNNFESLDRLIFIIERIKSEVGVKDENS